VVPAAVVLRSAAFPWSRLRTAATRAALATIVASVATLAPPSPREDVRVGLAATTRQNGFSIVGWEMGALADKTAALVRSRAELPTDDAARVRLAREHFENVAEIRRLRRRRDDLFARGDRPALAEVEAALVDRESRFDASRRSIEDVVAAQVDAVMRESGLRSQLFGLAPGWPVPFLRIEPEVFFAYQPLPLNLLVAPRDRIAIVGSVLVSPDLDSGQIEGLEARVDRLGVASLVGGIGGLGSYPSMIPDTLSLRQGLDAVAHEWVHHYLAFRPLGRAFFGSYEMRSINETVADMVGQEIGATTWQRYYAAAETTPGPAAASRPATSAPRADFGAEMRRIRAEVERRLGAGNVAGAEQYMAEQREELARLGFHVRKLNTAYLSFFGAYSGGANRYEAPLRALRAGSATLAEFLRKVENIATPEDLLRAG
jgi:hypothetical protein